MQNVAVAWLLLEMTNSPALLGLNWLFQFVPFICASMVVGAVADRMNRRKLLLVTHAALVVSRFSAPLLVSSKTGALKRLTTSLPVDASSSLHYPCIARLSGGACSRFVMP
jgi:hypothetical protein